ncbi:hypothetical protein BK005_00800 [bacterium CG10_37_50]|nr:MAG: hypothetical protein BK005_00800 [bacterium CG10_37_50]
MKKQQGIIKLIILIIIAVLILSYWGINLRQVAESDIGRANFSYLADLLTQGWSYLGHWWATFISPNLPNSINLLDFSKLGKG